MNSISLAGAATMLVLLAACSHRSAPDENTTSATVAEPARAAPAHPPAAAGCADRLPVELDRGETAMVDWKSIAAPRLEAFRSRAEAGFRAAADASCRAQPKLAAALKPIRRILVQSGSGATEPTFYRTDEKATDLVFQYAFVEADLEMSRKKAIEEGLECWADTARKGCEDMGD